MNRVALENEVEELQALLHQEQQKNNYLMKCIETIHMARMDTLWYNNVLLAAVGVSSIAVYVWSLY